MKFPFAVGGSKQRPFIVATVTSTVIELRPYRGKDGSLAVRVDITTDNGWGSRRFAAMRDSALPLGTLLRGLGFTLDDCRAALNEEG